MVDKEGPSRYRRNTEGVNTFMKNLLTVTVMSFLSRKMRAGTVSPGKQLVMMYDNSILSKGLRKNDNHTNERKYHTVIE